MVIKTYFSYAANGDTFINMVVKSYLSFDTKEEMLKYIDENLFEQCYIDFHHDKYHLQVWENGRKIKIND